MENLNEAKKNWIEAYTTGRFEKADKQVIQFIADFVFQNDENGNPTGVISQIFTSGYCYYFANMLKNAFQCGKVCWVEGRGHIVWQDYNGIAYDAAGVYEDYTCLRPVSYLGNTIVDFMHAGEEDKYQLGSTLFTDWCEHYRVTELFAVTYIWQCIPKNIMEEYDSEPWYDTVEKVSYDYWMKHQLELGEIFTEMKHKKNEF